MRVRIYKHSILATFLSMFGTGFSLGGIFILFNLEAGGIVILIIGICFMWWAESVNDKKTFTLWRKRLEENHIDQLITTSIADSVQVYNANPGKRTLEYIQGLNPQAAAYIRDQLSAKTVAAGDIASSDLAEKQTGIIDLHDEILDTWYRDNPYKGKHFSVLGDSISTLAGYHPSGYHVFYCGENCINTGVNEMYDTWWGKVIGFYGGELLVNNAWSGSRVTKLPHHDNLFPSGCCDERTGCLHHDNEKPDVIIVYLGTNDWANGVMIHYEEGSGDYSIVKETVFECAYRIMIEKLKRNYPHTEIWCCTLCPTKISSKESFEFPYEYGGIHIESYNEIIRAIVSDHHCKLIDLYSYHMPYDTVDGSHPNVNGMDTLARMMIQAMADSFASQH